MGESNHLFHRYVYIITNKRVIPLLSIKVYTYIKDYSNNMMRNNYIMDPLSSPQV